MTKLIKALDKLLKKDQVGDAELKEIALLIYNETEKVLIEKLEKDKQTANEKEISEEETKSFNEFLIPKLQENFNKELKGMDPEFCYSMLEAIKQWSPVLANEDETRKIGIVQAILMEIFFKIQKAQISKIYQTQLTKFSEKLSIIGDEIKKKIWECELAMLAQAVVKDSESDRNKNNLNMTNDTFNGISVYIEDINKIINSNKSIDNSIFSKIYTKLELIESKIKQMKNLLKDQFIREILTSLNELKKFLKNIPIFANDNSRFDNSLDDETFMNVDKKNEPKKFLKNKPILANGNSRFDNSLDDENVDKKNEPKKFLKNIPIFANDNSRFDNILDVETFKNVDNESNDDFMYYDLIDQNNSDQNQTVICDYQNLINLMKSNEPFEIKSEKLKNALLHKHINLETYLSLSFYLPIPTETTCIQNDELAEIIEAYTNHKGKGPYRTLTNKLLGKDSDIIESLKMLKSIVLENGRPIYQFQIEAILAWHDKNRIFKGNKLALFQNQNANSSEHTDEAIIALRNRFSRK